MIVFEEYGDPLTQQMGTMAADTSISSNSSAYQIKIVKMAYTVGNATLAPVCGDVIVAHDYVWDGVVLSTETNTGAWATANATGFIYIYNQQGTIVTTDVFNIMLTSNSTVVAAAGNASGIGSPTERGQSFTAPNGITITNGMFAKAALLETTGAALRITLDGTPPTPATLTNGLVSRGLYLENGNVLIVRGTNSVRNLKFCNAVAGNNSSYRIIYYF